MFAGESHELFSELSYNFEDNLFYLEEEKRGYLGFAFQFNPMQGFDSSTADKLNVLLNQPFPDGTFVQVTLWSSPDIHYQMKALSSLRKDAKGVMKQFCDSKVAFLKDAVREPLDTSSFNRVRDLRVILSVKVPCSTRVSDDEITTTSKLRANSKQILVSAGFFPATVDVEQHIRTMHSIFNWKDDAFWKRTDTGGFYDQNKIISDQLLDMESEITVQSDGIKVNGKYIKVLSPKILPEYVTTGMAMNYAGDIRNGTRGIKDPFMITTTLYFSSPEKMKQKLEQKRTWIVNQAHGPMLKFVPHLVTQKSDMDCMFETLNKGDRVTRMMMTFAVFGDDEESAYAASANMKTYYQEMGYTLMEDMNFCKPIFLNMLPFGADDTLIRDICRYNTVATSHAVRMLPVMGEWKGTGTPVMQFVSRSGQLMNNHLYDSGSNYNAVIAAASGSGKSFLTNDIIMSYLSIGARVWVIDVGRSYEKLSKAIDGSFLEFTRESNICLNPFDIVEDYEDESDVLIGILIAMAAQNDPLTDLQITGLRKTLKIQWDKHKKQLTVDHIAEHLLANNDQRIKDVGEQLYSFTSAGEYGRYFIGKNNTSLSNAFTVLELEELKGRKHLQQVVLLQLIYQIQQEMFLGVRDRPKLLIIDEAWDLLSNGAVAKFIEDSYRRVRKYGGAAIVVTQSVNDLYNNPGGEAIADNSANFYLLKQKSTVIDQLKIQKNLPLADGGYELLKTVHTNPGQYSEIFFITEYGAGIGRLYVNRFSQLLYSTKADEVQAINDISAELNCGIEVAINEYIRREQNGVAV